MWCIWASAATIWSIAGREENRKRIMDAFGIPPLIRMIQSNHLDCQSKASGAIRFCPLPSCPNRLGWLWSPLPHAIEAPP